MTSSDAPPDLPVPGARGRRSHWWWGILLAVATLVAVWLLVRRIDPRTVDLRTVLQDLATRLAERPAGGLIAALAYAGAGVVFVPITLLATVTLAVFGLWPGIAIAWAGGLSSALLSHALGRALGPRTLAWLPRRLQAALRGVVTRRAFWSVVVMRLAPVGNFGALNLLSGAIPLPWLPFLLGNAVTLLPGLLGLGIVVERVRALLRQPNAANVAWVVAAVGALVIVGLLVRRWLKRPLSPSPLAK